MGWLDQFGRPEFRYQGTGKLESTAKLPDGAPAGFELVQLSDGRMFCEFRRKDVGALTDKIESGTFIGHTEFGQSIRITGFTTVVSTTVFGSREFASQSIVFGNVDVESQAARTPVEFCFHLVNFKYGQHWTIPFEWEHLGIKFQLYPFSDYEERIEEIEGNRRVGTTTILRATFLDSGGNSESIFATVDEACSLFSLAQGRHIQWICYEGRTDDQVVQRRHRLAGPLQPTGPFLIPSNPDQTDYRKFITDCLPRYHDCHISWKIGLIISMYVEAVTQDVLESRGLKLAVLLDAIRAIYAEKSGMDKLIDDGAFKKIRPDLRRELHRVLSSLLPESSQDRISNMADHVSAFQWYPFRVVLKDMCKALRVNVSDEEISDFIQQRNSLAHQYKFTLSEKGIETCEKMMSTVSKIILAILGYTGYFYDWSIPANYDWTNRRVNNLYLVQN